MLPTQGLSCQQLCLGRLLGGCASGRPPYLSAPTLFFSGVRYVSKHRPLKRGGGWLPGSSAVGFGGGGVNIRCLLITKPLLCWPPPLLGAGGGGTGPCHQTETAPSHLCPFLLPTSAVLCPRNQLLSSIRLAGPQCRTCPRPCRPPHPEDGRSPPTCSGAEAQGRPQRLCWSWTSSSPPLRKGQNYLYTL